MEIKSGDSLIEYAPCPVVNKLRSAGGRWTHLTRPWWVRIDCALTCTPLCGADYRGAVLYVGSGVGSARLPHFRDDDLHHGWIRQPSRQLCAGRARALLAPPCLAPRCACSPTHGATAPLRYVGTHSLAWCPHGLLSLAAPRAILRRRFVVTKALISLYIIIGMSLLGAIAGVVGRCVADLPSTYLGSCV